MWIIRICKKYNVEPVLFLYMVARNLYFPTLYTQLITDKICRFGYNQSEEFCRLINNEEYSNTTVATLVFRNSVDYVMYGQWILAVPSILAAIFLGPWLDMHSVAPKIVLYLTIVAGLFESIFQLVSVYFFESDAALILISHILNGLTGGNMLFMTAIFTISMKETPLAERTFRFCIIEFAMVIPNPIANSISANLLHSKHWLLENQLRNYLPIYALSTLLLIISLVYVVFAIGEIQEVVSPNDDILKRASLRTSLQPLSTEYLAIKNNQRLHYTNRAFEHDNEENDDKEFRLKIERSVIKKPIQEDTNNNFLGNDLKEQKERSLSFHQSLPVLFNKDATCLEIVKSLFQLKNATSMVKCTLKRREEKAHILLWLIVTIYMLLLVFSNGMPLIMTSFITKVYKWKPEEYMWIDAYGHLAYGFISTFCLSYFHKIDLQDSITILIGLSGFLSINLFRGLILNPWGLYLGYVTGSVCLCSIVACRGFVAKIIPENEIGTILSVLSVFYATSPVLGSIIYTQIWKATLNIHPGMAFLFGACGTGVAIGCALYLHIRYQKYKTIMENKRKITNG